MILIQNNQLGGSIYKAYDVYPDHEPKNWELEVAIVWTTAGGVEDYNNKF